MSGGVGNGGVAGCRVAHRRLEGWAKAARERSCSASSGPTTSDHSTDSLSTEVIYQQPFLLSIPFCFVEAQQKPLVEHDPRVASNLGIHFVQWIYQHISLFEYKETF